jgi:predicted kinase
VWSRDERSALRALAANAGARCELVFLPIDEAEQRRRVADRLDSAAGTVFAITDEDLTRYRELFEAPDDDELACDTVDPPPAGCATWADWAAQRWPTSTGEPVTPR